MCLKELRDEFLYDCECRHLAKGSLRNYRASTRFLLEFLERKQITELEDVRPRHLRDLMKEKQDAGNTPRYINDLLKVWRTWFNYLVEEGYLEERDNPAKKVKPLRQPRTIIDTFTAAEMKRMIQFYDGKDFLEVRNKTIIMLLFDTGMRCNEMILMEPEDIKPDYILVKHGKGGKERVVPKSPALSKQLIKYCALRDGYRKECPTCHRNLFLSKTGKPLTDEAVARMLKHAAEEVGVSSSVRVSPHTCRHTFAQMQLKNGLDLYSVSLAPIHTVSDADTKLSIKRASPLAPDFSFKYAPSRSVFCRMPKNEPMSVPPTSEKMSNITFLVSNAPFSLIFNIPASVPDAPIKITAVLSAAMSTSHNSFFKRLFKARPTRPPAIMASALAAVPIPGNILIQERPFG